MTKDPAKALDGSHNAPRAQIRGSTDAVRAPASTHSSFPKKDESEEGTGDGIPEHRDEQRRQLIAEAAYFRAERVPSERGCARCAKSSLEVRVGARAEWESDVGALEQLRESFAAQLAEMRARGTAASQKPREKAEAIWKEIPSLIDKMKSCVQAFYHAVCLAQRNNARLTVGMLLERISPYLTRLAPN